jgi:protein-disulfide isomerase
MKIKGNATIWFAVGFIVLATVVIIVAAVVSSGSLDNTPSSDTPAPAITSDEWTKGPKDAKVTLIEYADFQCPACANYYPLIKNVLAAYSDKVLFVYREFPLYTIHPNAGISAQAAEAAGLQGKFWEMYDLLYTKQQEWSITATNRVVQDNFDVYAKSLGLDLDKFHQDINSDQVLKKIKRDVDGGTAAAVGQTPTFYVNLKQIQNPSSESELKSILDAALASS